MLKGEMNMENIKFYTNQEEDFLLAYEKDTGFFATYALKKEKWEYSTLSFSQYMHDLDFHSIVEEKAFKLTKGNMPKELYQEFLLYLKKIEKDTKKG